MSLRKTFSRMVVKQNVVTFLHFRQAKQKLLFENHTPRKHRWPYLADDILYWLQPYAKGLLWTARIQQEYSLVLSLWSWNGLWKYLMYDQQISTKLCALLGHCEWIGLCVAQIPGWQVLNFNPDCAGCRSFSIRPRDSRDGEKMTGRLVWTCTDCTKL